MTRSVFSPPEGKGLFRKFRPEWMAWRDMRNRCYKRYNPRWDSYGGRGIKVCKRWYHSFRNFLADMGPRPSRKHSLDRSNNDESYNPTNCRWATRKEQQRNRRTSHNITFNGETKNILAWAEELNVEASMILARIQRGWTPEEALTTRTWGRYKGAMSVTINGVTKTFRKWAVELGFKDFSTIYGRLERGWSPERALLTPARSYVKKTTR